MFIAIVIMPIITYWLCRALNNSPGIISYCMSYSFCGARRMGGWWHPCTKSKSILLYLCTLLGH